MFLRGEGSVPETITYLYTLWNRSVCQRWQSSVFNLEGYEMHCGYGHSESTVVRNWKDENGNRQRGAVPIPTPVYHYNKYMGGVDRSDQLIKYYNVLRQTKKYWKTLLFHCIDIAVVNAHIMNKEIVDKLMSQYLFRENPCEKPLWSPYYWYSLREQQTRQILYQWNKRGPSSRKDGLNASMCIL